MPRKKKVQPDGQTQTPLTPMPYWGPLQELIEELRAAGMTVQRASVTTCDCEVTYHNGEPESTTITLSDEGVRFVTSLPGSPGLGDLARNLRWAIPSSSHEGSVQLKATSPLRWDRGQLQSLLAAWEPDVGHAALVCERAGAA